MVQKEQIICNRDQIITFTSGYRYMCSRYTKKIYRMETCTKLTKIEKELIRIQDKIIMFQHRLIANNI